MNGTVQRYAGTLGIKQAYGLKKGAKKKQRSPEDIMKNQMR